MAIRNTSAFSDDEIKALSKTQKPSPKVHDHKTVSETSEKNSVAAKGSGPDGIHAVRGMSLKINEMLAMGCYTPDDIIKCITPMTRDYSEKQATVKLTSHIKNMQKHGAIIEVTEDSCIYCKDVVLPEL